MTTTLSTIVPVELAELCKMGNIELIDVRTPAEFQEVHVQGAKNIPLDRLNAEAMLASHANRTVYVICRSGSRGKQGCEKLLKAGLVNVVNVEGGTLACIQAGLAVVRGRKVMSLERQVRILAGGIACVGAVLALAVDPLFAGIPAFIGAGLVFAGVSNTCMMGMLIAKMPWNQRGMTCSTGS